MPRYARRFRHQPEQIVGKVHWLDGAEPDAFHASPGKQQAHKIGQTHTASRFAAPAAEIDAADHYFAVPRGEPADLRHHLFRRSAAAAASYIRNNAERAAIVAAVLYFQIGARALAGGVLNRR